MASKHKEGLNVKEKVSGGKRAMSDDEITTDSLLSEFIKDVNKRISELEKNGERDYLNIDANRDQINANLEGIGDCWKLLAELKEKLGELDESYCSSMELIKTSLENLLRRVRKLEGKVGSARQTEKKELYKCDECEYYNGTSGCWVIKGLYDQTHPKCTFKRKASGGEE